ncbi:uncharacterized protein LOC142633950 [Castanea sativa]|uniref:uncharacterized protein LOC142633950 n=1 Tax=Castanea sativa TaxID=21020 RepID=UPI003F6532A7
MSLVYFFDYAAVTTSTVTGWCVIASFLLSSLAGARIMLHLIKRAKKCLDFSAIVYIIHLFICIIYGGWPSSITWWVLNGTGVAVMALLGEYLCIRRELLEIPITQFRSTERREENQIRRRVRESTPFRATAELLPAVSTPLSRQRLGGSATLFNLAMDECPQSLPGNSPSMPNVQAPQSQYDSIEANGQSEIVNVPIDVVDVEDYNLNDFSKFDDNINEEFGNGGMWNQ